MQGEPGKFIEFYVNDTSVPLDKCFWKPSYLTNHAPGQSPGFVLPNPNFPFSYGIDANFGLNMNNSLPITNFFGYGDKLIIENITAHANPFWGLKNCSYSFSIDSMETGNKTTISGILLRLLEAAPLQGGHLVKVFVDVTLFHKS